MMMMMMMIMLLLQHYQCYFSTGVISRAGKNLSFLEKVFRFLGFLGFLGFLRF